MYMKFRSLKKSRKSLKEQRNYKHSKSNAKASQIKMMS